MIKRIVVGIILAGIMVGMLFLREVSIYIFDGLIMFVILAGLYELIRLFKVDMTISTIVTISLYGICVYPAYFFFDVFGMLLLSVVFFLIINVVALFDKNMTFNSVLKFLFMLFYPTILIAFLLPINHNVHGLALICLLLGISVMTDTMALFVGVTVKGKKLCPSISPKKTISGAIGGLFGGVLGAVIIYFIIINAITFDFSIGNIWVCIILGFIGAILTQFGDLVASNLKRKADVKDFGSLIPGHGGIVDRIDGIIFNILLMYFFMLIFL